MQTQTSGRKNVKRGRQRTIDDNIWRYARMRGSTVEDKFAMLYLLTSPYSNIIGAYEIVIPITASELGWDAETQLMPVLRRLADSGRILFHSDSSFVWVRNWWDHNQLTSAFSPKLRERAFDEINRLPETWQKDYILALIERITEPALKSLIVERYRYPIEAVLPPQSAASLNQKTKSHTNSQPNDFKSISAILSSASIPSPDPIDRVADNTTTTNPINNSTTNSEVIHNLELPPGLHVDQIRAAETLLRHVAPSDAQMLLDELTGALGKPGFIKTDPISCLRGLLAKYQKGEFVLASGLPIHRQRESRWSLPASR